MGNRIVVLDEWIFTVRAARGRRCEVKCLNPEPPDREFAAGLARLLEAWIGAKRRRS